ncbi:hypothetical protein [Gordonia soli]|uniref:NTP pyrophosphohydrolase n=1 Tax=Gordonia soli NBRC 108243 TaxID=1223545 RepID=M0QN40_9ACTN|nr:hypothetical protein [Gordonia soli]GAC69706.1 hypothetical protein GS4_26_01540 [Gordonia soli NBRC 108243]
MTDPTLVVVDAANVVGSVPDGWWRDRRAATERLRDALASTATTGVTVAPGPVEIVLVVEGRARGVESSTTVRVIASPGSGDDQIVEVVGKHPNRRRVVVTADRGLRERVQRLGAEVTGPSAVPRRVDRD